MSKVLIAAPKQSGYYLIQQVAKTETYLLYQGYGWPTKNFGFSENFQVVLVRSHSEKVSDFINSIFERSSKNIDAFNKDKWASVIRRAKKKAIL